MTATTETRPPASKVYQAPGNPDSPVEVKPRYENFIGGRWVAPVKGQYMKDLSPTNAEHFTEVPRSTAEDIEVALDAAHAAKKAWGETSLTERAKVLNRIADAIEDNLEMLAVAETWDNGKRSARRWLLTSRSPPIISVTSPVRPGRCRARAPRSTRTPSPTTSTSPWGWWDRSSRSTSRC